MSSRQIMVEHDVAHGFAVQAFLITKGTLVKYGRLKNSDLEDACWRFIRFVASALRCAGVDDHIVRIGSADGEPPSSIRGLDLQTARRCLELSDRQRRRAWSLGSDRFVHFLSLMDEAMFATDDLILACERPWDSQLPTVWFTLREILASSR